MSAIFRVPNAPNFQTINLTKRRRWIQVVDRFDRTYVLDIPVQSANSNSLNNFISAVQPAITGLIDKAVGGVNPALQYDVPRVPPTDVGAVHELAWRVSIRHATLDLSYTFLITCADASLVQAGTNNMDTSWSGYADFRNRVEGFVKLPETTDDDDVILDSVVLVGTSSVG